MKITVSSTKALRGEISLPGDKSISHRAIMLGALARGTTQIMNFLTGEDCISTIKAFRSMGIQIDLLPSGEVVVYGQGLRGLNAPKGILNAGNSGTTTRLLMGILAGQAFETIMDGDPSLRGRPMKRVTAPLRLMGANITGPEDGNRLPLTIKGSALHGIDYSMPVASAQVKSALILASLFADTPSVIRQKAPSRDHTELMIRFFGGQLSEDAHTITAYPASDLYGQAVKVPGDISSAAFFLTAALLVPDSELLLKNTGVNPTRTGILDVYHSMGADIHLLNTTHAGGEPTADIQACFSSLKGTTIEGSMIPRLIDEIPIIALAATQAQGTTIIRDAAELKVKESDRIATVCTALAAMGANITPTEDGMIIEGPTPLIGTTVSCLMDHRIAMMGAVAGLIAQGETILDGGEWVDISFPGFFEQIKRLRS